MFRQLQNPRRDENLGVAVDITERKSAGNENMRLAIIVNSPDDAIFSATRDGLIVTWNAGAERMYGYVAEEIRGKSISILVPEDKRLEMTASRGRLLSGESLVHYEQESIRKDGSRFQPLLTLSPLKDHRGSVDGISAIARDITERKRTDADRIRLTAAVEQAAEVVVITNIAGGIEYVNPAFTRITGYAREEVLGLNARILKPGKQEAALYQEVWATILRGEIWYGES